MSTSVLQTHHQRLHALSLQAGESPRLQEVSLSLLQNTLACTSMNITRALILHSSNLVELRSWRHPAVLTTLVHWGFLCLSCCLVTGKVGTASSPPPVVFVSPFAQVYDLLCNTEAFPFSTSLLSPHASQMFLQDPDNFHCPRESLEGFEP